MGRFIDTRPRSSRWFESPDSRPGERTPSGLQCRVSHAPRPLLAVLRVTSPSKRPSYFLQLALSQCQHVPKPAVVEIDKERGSAEAASQRANAALSWNMLEGGVLDSFA
jgi:hypothetical protein